MTKKNIFVSGSHRSGSTWVGNVIGSAKGMRYVFEPFNINIKRRNRPMSYWFQYYSQQSTQQEQDSIQHYLNSFLHIFHQYNISKFFHLRSLREGYRHLRDLAGRLGKRTVIKDPIAILSAEWIYQQYGWYMVILIRHPAAFVASLKVADWKFPFEDFLQQPLLMQEYYQSYEHSIKEYAIEQKDIIKQGILLWNLIHHVIKIYQEKYKSEWYFARHEDLSIHPLEEYEKMFQFLDLSFDEEVKNFITDSTTSKDAEKLKRDAKENTKSWKKRLTADEILEIKTGTEGIWRHFYAENDW